MGTTAKSARRYGSIDADEVVRRFTVDGISGQQIARDFGVRRGAIYAILKAAGVDNQRGWRSHPPGETRVCTACRRALPLGAFGTFIRTNKRRRVDGRLEQRSGHREHRAECRSCYAERFRKAGWTFTAATGLTVAQYERLLADQGGVCAICGRTNNAKCRLGVDHDHRSDIIRGLLCHRCNSRLEALDDVEWNRRAIEYVRSARTPYRWADREHNARVDSS